MSTSPNEGTGTYFLSMGRQNAGAVPRRDFSYLPPTQTNIPNPWRSSGMIPPAPEDSIPTFQGMGLRGITSTSSVITHTTTMSGVRSTMAPCVAPGLQAPSSIPTSVSAHLGRHLPTPPPTVPTGFAVGHPGQPIVLKTHRWNVKFNGQDEAAAFLERLEEISGTENISKYRLLTDLPELLYVKALLWYRSNKGFWDNWETFKETFRMAFYPVDYQEDLELEISRRIQRCSESAIDYIIDLQTLIRRHERLTAEQETLRLEVVENCCIRLGLEPSRQTGTQPRQADGTFCTTTQAFSPQMTVGQERLVHELLSPHLTVDIILGMDILTNKFRIDLASNTVFLNGEMYRARKPSPLCICTFLKK
ncbi:hypothetical protein JTB14_015425 [Gonioctena quinquepunctata]|nr:hypothetical protein JTB14_015425 [Gonioctena quinquepunctata]